MSEANADSERLSRNLALADKIVNTFLDEEDTKSFKDGTSFEVFLRDKKTHRDEIGFQFIGNIDEYKSIFTDAPIPHTLQGPIIEVTPGEEEQSITHHTRYGDLPQVFADSTGREFVLINHYFISLTGQAFVGQFVDYFGNADNNTPKFDFEMDVNKGYIGTRNFDEEDYVVVNKMVNVYTNGEYEELPLDEHGRRIEESS